MYATNKLAQSLTLLPSFMAYFEPFIQQCLPMWRVQGVRTKVLAVRLENMDMYSLVLKPNRAWRGFHAGQHVQLTVQKNGAWQTRTFSISSAPADFVRTGKIELSIRVQPQGLITPWLKEYLANAASAYVSLSQAQGEFVLPLHDKPLLLVAGGSGITPFRAILQHLAQTHSSQQVQLIYYAREAGLHVFEQELVAISQALPNIKITLLNDKEHGLFSAEQLLKHCPDYAKRHIMLCGPVPMLGLIRSTLADLNFPAEQLTYEYFGAAPLAVERLAEGSALVSFKRAKLSTEMAAKQSQTVLTLAEDLGLKPLSGCRAGVCHQCVCRKESGVVLNTLTGKESGTGAEEIQLCVSVPRTDLIVDL